MKLSIIVKNGKAIITWEEHHEYVTTLGEGETFQMTHTHTGEKSKTTFVQGEET